MEVYTSVLNTEVFLAWKYFFEESVSAVIVREKIGKAIRVPTPSFSLRNRTPENRSSARHPNDLRFGLKHTLKFDPQEGLDNGIVCSWSQSAIAMLHLCIPKHDWSTNP